VGSAHIINKWTLPIALNDIVQRQFFLTIKSLIHKGIPKNFANLSVMADGY